MIHEVAGDILLTRAGAIAHGVAPDEHFHSGLALALREKYPVMARDFRHYSHQCGPKPGELWEWGGVGGVRMFNLITQDQEHGHGGKPGPATEATANHCLRRLRHELASGRITSIALPKLATGVGGLPWEKVEPLVRTHLGDLPIAVYLYTTYHPGVSADEPTA